MQYTNEWKVHEWIHFVAGIADWLVNEWVYLGQHVRHWSVMVVEEETRPDSFLCSTQAAFQQWLSFDGLGIPFFAPAYIIWTSHLVVLGNF